MSDARHRGLAKKIDALVGVVGASETNPIEAVESVYQYLQIRHVPKPGTPTIKDRQVVELACLSLLVIAACDKHLRVSNALDSSLSDIWPSIWRWIDFLHKNCCQKATYGDHMKLRALTLIPATLATLGHSSTLRPLVTTTPNVISMMTKYWADEGKHPAVEAFFEAGGLDRPFTRALDSLLDPQNLTPNCLPDVVAAVSGGAPEVARLALKHMDEISQLSAPKFEVIFCHLSLINNLANNTFSPLHFALLNCGIIPRTIKMLNWINSQSNSDIVAARSVMICYFTLVDSIMSTNGSSWVNQAFDSGIVPSILHTGHYLTQISEHYRGQCTSIFPLLCQYLVYHSVLRSVGKFLRRMERRPVQKEIAGPLWDGWLLFQSLAKERLKMNEESEHAFKRYCERLGVSQSVELV